MPKILSVVGARPQFIKHAPVQIELRKRCQELTVHTGQHYDDAMSRVFFQELALPQPDFQLDLGGASLHGSQTAAMLTQLEALLVAERPDALLVYGDTNSTLAGVLAAVKLHIPVIHIEAGLRSFNMKMPEEVNRIIADRFSALLFCPSDVAVENLRREGIARDNIYRTGDVMADALRLVRPLLRDFSAEKPYYFVTLHRPSNTDHEQRLRQLFSSLSTLDANVIFPVHPRTAARAREFGIVLESYPNIRFVGPLGYIDCISYQAGAQAIITDSGGVQKEAYMLKKLCLTLRSETEWVETLEHGWNQLLYDNLSALPKALARTPGRYRETLFGDGHAASTIVEHILERLDSL